MTGKDPELENHDDEGNFQLQLDGPEPTFDNLPDITNIPSNIIQRYVDFTIDKTPPFNFASFSSEQRRFSSTEEFEYFFNPPISSARSPLLWRFTFERELTREEALSTFCSFIREVSLLSGENVGWILGEELRLYPLDRPVVRQFWAVLLSFDVAPGGIETRCNRYLGEAKCQRYDREQGDEMGYFLKDEQCNQVDWTFCNYLYLWFRGYEPQNEKEKKRIERYRLNVARIKKEKKIRLSPGYSIEDAFRLLTPSTIFEPLKQTPSVPPQRAPVFCFSDKDTENADAILATDGLDAVKKFLNNARRQPFVQGSKLPRFFIDRRWKLIILTPDQAR
jgi:hypothetical protein